MHIFREPESWYVSTGTSRSPGPKHAWYKWLNGSRNSETRFPENKSPISGMIKWKRSNELTSSSINPPAGPPSHLGPVGYGSVLEWCPAVRLLAWADVVGHGGRPRRWRGLEMHIRSWFFCSYAATQLALQLHQERTQVVCSLFVCLLSWNPKILTLPPTLDSK